MASTVDALYDGTLDDAAWDRALVGVADLARASGALLLSFNPSSGEVLRDEAHRFDLRVLDEYRRYWTYHDLRRPPFVTMPVGCPATEQTLRIPQWEKAPILNEFLLPSDVPHCMPVWLNKSATKVVALSLQGSRRRGAFDAHDLATFRAISPHVGRALAIRDRLARERIRADALAQPFCSANIGVVFLDALGRILDANGAAQEFLRADSGIVRKCDGTLTLRQPAGTELSRWISSASAPPTGADGLLHVARAHAPQLSVLVTRLPCVSWTAAEPRWMLLIFDPARRVHASAVLIARDLAVSSCEAELAALLVAGYNLSEAATRLKVSVHTARSQLKSVFRKTGLHSQSDLVRHVALSPAAFLPG